MTMTMTMTTTISAQKILLLFLTAIAAVSASETAAVATASASSSSSNFVEIMEGIGGGGADRHLQQGDPFEFCPDQLNFAQDCFERAGSNANARNCRECIADAFINNDINNDGIPDKDGIDCDADVATGRLCTVAKRCSTCGNCGDLVADLLACDERCQAFDCKEYKPPAPTPKPFLGTKAPTVAPTIPVDCDTRQSKMNQCFAIDPAADVDSCSNCFFSYFPDGGVGCISVQGACKLFDVCPSCGTCAKTLFEVFTCALECPRIDCSNIDLPTKTISPKPTPAPQPVAPTISPKPTEPRPTHAPQPTAKPTISPKPTIVIKDINNPNDCAADNAVLEKCLENVDRGQESCRSCVLGHWPATVRVCSDIDDHTCAGITNCPCDGCTSEFQTYVKCLSGGCTFDCGAEQLPSQPTPPPQSPQPSAQPSASWAPTGAGDPPRTPRPTVPPAATPPAVPVERCPNKMAAFGSCLDKIETRNSCEGCITEYTPKSSVIESCEQLQSEVCTGMDTCSASCSACDEEFMSYVECLVPGCIIDCPSSDNDDSASSVLAFIGGSARTKCRTRENEYEECLSTDITNDEANECSKCVNKKLINGMYKDTSDCSYFEDGGFCDTLRSCETCGTCKVSVQKWLDCVAEEDPSFPDDCGVICVTDGTSSTSAASSLFCSFIVTVILSWATALFLMTS